MRQAITTTFHGPTNYRGARVTAKADAGRITVAWDYSLSVCDNHAAAARALVDRLAWGGRWVGGSLPGSGYVFVDASTGKA
jgi:hypothetical protein